MRFIDSLRCGVALLMVLVAFACVQAQGLPGMPDPEQARAEFKAFGQAADSAQTHAVHAALAAYREALLAQDGAAAWEAVDAHTRAYYAELIQTCQMGDSAALVDLSVLDLMTVLAARIRTPAAELVRFNGRDFFVYAVDAGMIGKGGVMGMDAGIVRTAGDDARAEALMHGESPGIFLDFHREEGTWRFDLTSIFGIAEAALTLQIQSQNQRPAEFIFEVLELMTGEKPDPGIWHPLVENGKP